MKRFHLIASVIIILVGILAHSNSFSGQFVFDDYISIITNEAIRNFLEYMGSLQFVRTRFIVQLSFALNFAVNGLDVVGYHLINLGIHISTSIVFYWFLQVLFETPQLHNIKSRYHKPLSLCVALLFVVHPLQTQAVTYISQRATSLGALFYLLTLVLFLNARLRKSKKWLILSFGSFIAALFTKENTYTLPVAVMALEFYFFHPTKNYLRRVTGTFAVYSAIALIAYYVNAFGLSAIPSEVASVLQAPTGVSRDLPMPRLDYLLTQPKVIVTYIFLLFFPVSQNADYDFPVTKSIREPAFLGAVFVLVFYWVLCLRLYNKNKLASFGIFFFFLALVVESSVIPLSDLIQEHRIYLPSIGFFLLLYALLVRILNNMNNLKRYFLYGVLIALILLAAFATFNRNKVWRDEVSFWQDVVAKSPQKRRGHFNLGVAFASIKRYEEAKKEFSTVLALDPQYYQAVNNLAVIAEREGDFDKAENLLLQTIEAHPKELLVRSNLGGLYSRTGMIDKANEEYEQVLAIDPHDAYAHLGLAQIYELAGKNDLALQYYKKAVAYNPYFVEGYYNLAAYLGNHKEYDKAIETYKIVLRLDPTHVRSYHDLGLIYAIINREKEAITSLEKAVKLDPDFQSARLYLDKIKKRL